MSRANSPAIDSCEDAARNSTNSAVMMAQLMLPDMTTIAGRARRGKRVFLSSPALSMKMDWQRWVISVNRFHSSSPAHR